MKHKKLADQAWIEFNDNGVARCDENDLERFAELVRDDERGICAKHYLVIVEQIKKDEREACAALVEGGNHVHPKAPDSIWAKTVAKLIRARGNK